MSAAELDAGTLCAILVVFGVLVSALAAALAWCFCCRQHCRGGAPSLTGRRIFDGLRRSNKKPSPVATTNAAASAAAHKQQRTSTTSGGGGGVNGHVKYSGKAIDIANRYAIQQPHAGVCGANNEKQRQTNGGGGAKKFTVTPLCISTTALNGGGAATSPTAQSPPPVPPRTGSIPKIIVTRASIKSAAVHHY